MLVGARRPRHAALVRCRQTARGNQVERRAADAQRREPANAPAPAHDHQQQRPTHCQPRHDVDLHLRILRLGIEIEDRAGGEGAAEDRRQGARQRIGPVAPQKRQRHRGDRECQGPAAPPAGLVGLAGLTACGEDPRPVESPRPPTSASSVASAPMTTPSAPPVGPTKPVAMRAAFTPEVPPQSTSLSVPFLTPSVAVGVAHWAAVQTPLSQSLAAAQVRPA